MQPKALRRAYGRRRPRRPQDPPRSPSPARASRYRLRAPSPGCPKGAGATSRDRALRHQPVGAGRRQPGKRAHVGRRQPDAIGHARKPVGVIRAAAALRVEQPAADAGPVDFAGILVLQLERQHLPQPSHSDSHSAGLISSSVLVFQNGSSIAAMWPSRPGRSSKYARLTQSLMRRP